MQVSRVATRYAKSLLELCIEQKTVDAVFEDIRLIRDTCAESREFRSMLNSPVIKSDKKFDIFKKIFAGKIGELSFKFFNIIIRKKREDLIFDITQSFVDQYKEFKHIEMVEVDTAVPLNEENKKKVLDYIKQRTSNTVELVEKVDPSLIGGIKIKMNDLLLDASVRTNLAKLEREFSKDLYSVKY